MRYTIFKTINFIGSDVVLTIMKSFETCIEQQITIIRYYYHEVIICY